MEVLKAVEEEEEVEVVGVADKRGWERWWSCSSIKELKEESYVDKRNNHKAQ